MLHELPVASVMTTRVVTVKPETPFRELARTMTEAQLDAVPVVDGLGRPIGVVSRADLVPEQGHGARSRTAAELMSPPVRAVHADEPVSFVAQVLAKTGIRRLFVVNWDSRLVGVVARRDLLRAHPLDDAELSTRIAELLDDAELAPV